MNPLYRELQSFGKVKADEPMSKHTTFKIGGPAKFFVIVESIEALTGLLDFVRGAGEPYLVIGGGSNMLVSDEGFDGVVIEVRAKEMSIEAHSMHVDAGCITVDVAQASIKAGLTGFEWGVGVPGTIGGAVRGNAGAMGGEMKDTVSSVTVYSDGEVMMLSAEECAFGYRDSAFKHNTDIVLRATLDLTPATAEETQSGMKKALEHLSYRNKTQPKGWASTGCMFKNPDFTTWKEKLLAYKDQSDEKVQQFERVGKISAGWLVQESGMKGKKTGNAEVSETHGNFIINGGNATAADVLSLVEQVKEAVYTTFGISLEEEIHIIY